MIELDDFIKNATKKNFGVFLTKFDLYIDIVLIVYMFCAKNLFFKVRRHYKIKMPKMTQ